MLASKLRYDEANRDIGFSSASGRSRSSKFFQSKSEIFNMKSVLSAVIAGGLMTLALMAQGDNTRAKPGDWEEVNFETNSAVLVDGFPSLLRLADLLKAHPDYKVTIVGNADQRGGNRVNDALATRRANAVAQFLEKYGAQASQVTVRSDGKRNLEENARNRNAYFINRR